MSDTTPLIAGVPAPDWVKSAKPGVPSGITVTSADADNPPAIADIATFYIKERTKEPLALVLVVTLKRSDFLFCNQAGLATHDSVFKFLQVRELGVVANRMSAGFVEFVAAVHEAGLETIGAGTLTTDANMLSRKSSHAINVRMGSIEFWHLSTRRQEENQTPGTSR